MGSASIVLRLSLSITLELCTVICERLSATISRRGPAVNRDR
jgi:hypothetical protein